MTKQWKPLTDPQWAAISLLFNLKNKRKHNLREIVNIILWLVLTGCQWRNLPEKWPNWQAVYYYRTDFYGLSKGGRIIFVIFLTLTNYRANPINELVANCVQHQHRVLALAEFA